MPVTKACNAQVMVDEWILPVIKSHFNPTTSTSNQKCPFYSGNLNSETSRDSNIVLLHCGDGLAILTAVDSTHVAVWHSITTRTIEAANKFACTAHQCVSWIFSRVIKVTKDSIVCWGRYCSGMNVKNIMRSWINKDLWVSVVCFPLLPPPPPPGSNGDGWQC